MRSMASSMLMASRRIDSGRRCSVRRWERSFIGGDSRIMDGDWKVSVRLGGDRAEENLAFSSGAGRDIGREAVERGGREEGESEGFFGFRSDAVGVDGPEALEGQLIGERPLGKQVAQGFVADSTAAEDEVVHRGRPSAERGGDTLGGDPAGGVEQVGESGAKALLPGAFDTRVEQTDHVRNIEALGRRQREEG